MTEGQINDVINNLCQKIGSTQQMLIPEMARLCIVRSWIYAAFCVIFVLLCITGLIISIKKYSHNDYWVVGIVCFPIAGFSFLCCLWVSISEAIQWQFAPTAKAIEYIITLIN